MSVSDWRRGPGRLFHRPSLGPATAKLRSPSFVLVQGTTNVGTLSERSRLQLLTSWPTYKNFTHVRGVRPNRATKFRGPQFRIKKSTCQFEQLWCLDYGANTDINSATRCILRAYNAAKCDCGRGSYPDPAGTAYSAPQTLWLVFRRALRSREGKRRKGKGGGEVKGRKGTRMGWRGGDRSWNRADDWLRPAVARIIQQERYAYMLMAPHEGLSLTLISCSFSIVRYVYNICSIRSFDHSTNLLT